MEWLFLKIENGMALSLSVYIGREETIEDILRIIGTILLTLFL